MKNNKNNDNSITFNGVIMNNKITFKDLILEYLIKEIKNEENGL